MRIAIHLPLKGNHLWPKRVINRIGPEKKRQFKCKQCNKVLKTKQSLAYHRKTHLDLDKRTKFGCHQCDRSFFHQSTLNQHINSFHSKINLNTCKECGMEFISKHNLERHVKRHINPNKREKFRCAECNKSYLTQESRDGHVNAVHERLPELTCTWPDCQRTLLTKTGLRRHIKEVHQKMNHYPCPLNSQGGRCLKVFQRKEAANNHFRVVHLKDRVPCPLAGCVETFSDLTAARAHYRRVHEGISAKWRCPHCSRLLVNMDCLLHHIDRLHKKIRFDCKECDRTFVTMSTLAKHQSRYHS